MQNIQPLNSCRTFCTTSTQTLPELFAIPTTNNFTKFDFTFDSLSSSMGYYETFENTFNITSFFTPFDLGRFGKFSAAGNCAREVSNNRLLWLLAVGPS